MLIFDQLKKNDPQLRVVALAILSGLGVLSAGLWWVQIVSSKDYQAHLEMQSFRTVRIPAVRGKILDRNGAVLAENRATYDVSLYLEELRKRFDDATDKQLAAVRAYLKQQRETKEKQLRRTLNKEERKQFLVSLTQKAEIRRQARYQVASNAVFQVGQMLRLSEPLTLDQTNFERHYQQSLALPFRVLTNISPAQIALFEEQTTGPTGVDLEVQSTRFYPQQTVAAHLLGQVQQNTDSAEGEEAFFSYRLPDYKGILGIEAGYDKELRGVAGAKSVVVNNIGYRQTETIWTPARAGNNVTLTIDIGIQKATEQALRQFSPKPMAAAVVLDVWTGDILALASIPGFNPNYFVHGFPPGEYQRIQDESLKPMFNRATQGGYAPGSIFKTVVAMAALEHGLDPDALYHVDPDPANPSKGCYIISRNVKPIADLASPGEYNFRRALKRSSNSYFIQAGVRYGIEPIVRLGHLLHLGERTGLNTRQEAAGTFVTLDQISSGWSIGATANVCIGQNPVYVTPLQMGVLAAAIANGGKVLTPRLVDTIEPLDPIAPRITSTFPKGVVRDNLGISPRNLNILREAMLADVEDSDGTGRAAFIPGFRISGKTGTAQVKDLRGNTTSHNVWFLSFAPYEKPRYAVIVMVEGGSSGGGDCAPIGRHIYNAIIEREQAANKPVAVNR
jgi:penicillin-binding protein 2